MNPLIQCKTTIVPLLIAGVLACFAISPMAQAVVPAPDGGYPGGNTAEGQAALLSLTTGGFNTAVGFFSLRSNTTNSFNTAVGAGTLLANTADNNTATGAGALLSNTTGLDNTANGAFALFGNTEGSANTANGYGALYHNTTGDENTAIGSSALVSNTGSFNTAVGTRALFFDTTGNNNTAVGRSALFSNTTGVGNTAIGEGALLNNGTGNTNIALGPGAGHGVTSANNVICILAPGADVSNSCYISQIFGETSASGAAVYINSNNKLGTLTSSSRFKDDIKPMERTSKALFALKPVTFRYKKGIDPQGIPQFGLVAEDVEKINPDLVVRDKEGKPYSVRYDQVNAMLLNEFLKEHRKVQEQERRISQLESTVSKQDATIAQQQKGMKAVTARLNEQATQIQKVSAQIELSNAVGQTALNNP